MAKRRRDSAFGKESGGGIPLTAVSPISKEIPPLPLPFHFRYLLIWIYSSLFVGRRRRPRQSVRPPPASDKRRRGQRFTKPKIQSPVCLWSETYMLDSINTAIIASKSKETIVECLCAVPAVFVFEAAAIPNQEKINYSQFSPPPPPPPFNAKSDPLPLPPAGRKRREKKQDLAFPKTDIRKGKKRNSWMSPSPSFFTSHCLSCHSCLLLS